MTHSTKGTHMNNSYLLGLDEVETENFESAIIWKKLR